MRFPILYRILFASLVTLLCATADTHADYITGKLAGSTIDGVILNPGAAVEINLGNGLAPSVAYYPGVVNWTVGTGPSGKPNASWVSDRGSTFKTFCIELTQDISPGNNYTYTLMALADAPNPGSSQTGGPGGMGTTKATAIEDLWTLDYSSIFTSSTPNVNAAAFQLAIWKIEYDWGGLNPDTFTAGNFQAAGNSSDGNDAVALATTWLDTLASDITAGTVTSANLVALNNASSPFFQAQVMELPSDTLHYFPNPVPPTIYLAGIGGFVLMLFGLRQQRLAIGIVQG